MRRINAVRNSRRRPFSCSHIYSDLMVLSLELSPHQISLPARLYDFPLWSQNIPSSRAKSHPPSVNLTSFALNMAVGVSRVVSALMCQMEGNQHPSGDGDGDQDKRNRQIPADAACSFSSGCVKTGEKSRAERRRLPDPCVYIPRVWNYLAASASRLFFPPFTAH